MRCRAPAPPRARRRRHSRRGAERGCAGAQRIARQQRHAAPGFDLRALAVGAHQRRLRSRRPGRVAPVRRPPSASARRRRTRSPRRLRHWPTSRLAMRSSSGSSAPARGTPMRRQPGRPRSCSAASAPGETTSSVARWPIQRLLRHHAASRSDQLAKAPARTCACSSAKRSADTGSKHTLSPGASSAGWPQRHRTAAPGSARSVPAAGAFPRVDGAQAAGDGHRAGRHTQARLAPARHAPAPAADRP